MVLDDFYDSRSAKAAQHLRILMLVTTLGNVQRIAHVVLYNLGESRKSLRLVPTQVTGFKDGTSVMGIR